MIINEKLEKEKMEQLIKEFEQKTLQGGKADEE